MRSIYWSSDVFSSDLGMYFKIAQYQEDGVEVPTFYGPPVPIDLSQLRDTNLSTVIGQGLMAIDRQYVMQLVQQIVFALIQNPRAAEQVDILGQIGRESCRERECQSG